MPINQEGDTTERCCVTSFINSATKYVNEIKQKLHNFRRKLAWKRRMKSKGKVWVFMTSLMNEPGKCVSRDPEKLVHSWVHNINISPQDFSSIALRSRNTSFNVLEQNNIYPKQTTKTPYNNVKDTAEWLDCRCPSFPRLICNKEIQVYLSKTLLDWSKTLLHSL